MAKIGIEVEGMMQGEDVRTFFCSTEEYIRYDIDKLMEFLDEREVEMIYISDHHNELDLNNLGEVFEDSGFAVTVELTELTEEPPANVAVFWNVSQASYAQSRTIHFLRAADQIKIENEKTVLSFVARNAVITLPQDFDGDREV